MSTTTLQTRGVQVELKDAAELKAMSQGYKSLQDLIRSFIYAYVQDDKAQIELRYELSPSLALALDKEYQEFHQNDKRKKTKSASSTKKLISLLEDEKN